MCHVTAVARSIHILTGQHKHIRQVPALFTKSNSLQREKKKRKKQGRVLFQLITILLPSRKPKTNTAQNYETTLNRAIASKSSPGKNQSPANHMNQIQQMTWKHFDLTAFSFPLPSLYHTTMQKRTSKQENYICQVANYIFLFIHPIHHGSSFKETMRDCLLRLAALTNTPERQDGAHQGLLTFCSPFKQATLIRLSSLQSVMKSPHFI